MLERSFTAGEQVVIGVDGFGGASGDYVLNIVPAGTTEGDCTNGDDDVDGLADCEDPDCAADLHCIPESDCGNATDDDLDGLADCLDTDCAAETRCIPESDCGNVTDDDLDGLTDCADSDCATDARCLPEADCADGADTDLDGLTDCDDSDCAADAHCLPETDCADGTDNDFDGATDCDDSDCAPTATCLATCLDVTDLGSALGAAIVTGTTTGGTNDLAGSCGGSSAEDLAYTWTAPYDDTFTFSTDGSSYDTVLVLGTGDCAGLTEIDCDDDDGAGNQSLLTATLAAGDIVLVDIDGWSTSAGDFQLNVYPSSERDCADGADEDGDGAADCDDSDCDLSCPEDACADGLDDDADGLTDCDDTDCAADASCLVESDCNDGLDDDGDGYTDCDDPSCATDAYCLANACYDDALGDAYGDAFATVALDGDDVTAACGYGGADGLVSWTAPGTGTWTISATPDTSYEYVALDVSSGDCTALTSLACDESFAYYYGDPSVTLALTAGDTVSFAVEAYYGYATSATLTAWPDAEFDCFDGVDDDGDGSADCADSECASACFELDCTDGLDGDADGATDCDDTDCVTDPSCVPETDCADGADNDLDGATDCSDSDCAAAFECTATCLDDNLGSALGYGLASGSTVGQGDDRTPSCPSGSTTPTAGDVAFLWTAPLTDTYTFTTSGSSYDTMITVEEPSCTTVELACDDDISSSDFDSTVSVSLAAGDQVIVNVDGYGSREGAYVLSIYGSTELACADGTDDDGDGDTDCDDTDCAADAACVVLAETVCADRLDDEGDGLVDCLDTDCATSASCTSSLADYVLGSVTSGSSSGSAVATGTTAGATASLSSTCSGSSTGRDLTYLWVAPTTATYTFSTAGSAYDTILSLHSLGGTALTCNDDVSYPTDSTSILTRSMNAGEAILVVVDGYNSASGSFSLRIY